MPSRNGNTGRCSWHDAVDDGIFTSNIIAGARVAGCTVFSARPKVAKFELGHEVVMPVE